MCGWISQPAGGVSWTKEVQHSDGNNLAGSSHGGCRGPAAEAGKLAAIGWKIVSAVKAWAAYLRDSMAFELRSRMRMEGELHPSETNFKREENLAVSLRVYVTPQLPWSVSSTRTEPWPCGLIQIQAWMLNSPGNQGCGGLTTDSRRPVNSKANKIFPPSLQCLELGLIL